MKSTEFVPKLLHLCWLVCKYDMTAFPQPYLDSNIDGEDAQNVEHKFDCKSRKTEDNQTVEYLNIEDSSGVD